MLFSNLLRQNALESKKHCWTDSRSIVALLSAYQEYLLTFKSMSSQVLHDHYVGINGYLGLIIY